MLLQIAQALGRVDQDYLLEARQMQALSFAVHIPLVCFGVAFPALVLGMEWLGHRRGDPLLLALARRWSKVMIALFAVGVVTGTILSFELGLLWPQFMATYGDVFGLAFALEGFSFFVEAIFIAIYVYGWDRLSPRAHMLVGIPVAIAGFSGSLMVITVNGWMNHPSGFRMENGRAVDIHPIKALFGNSYFWHEMVHMYLAAFLVAGFVTASVYGVAWLRGRRDRYVRIAMAVPPFPAATFELPFYYVLLALLALTMLISFGAMRSKFGLSLAAIRADEDKARGIGVRVFGVKVLAFSISVGLTAMVGGVWAYYEGYIYPQFAIDPLLTIAIVLMTFLGGRATLWGPVIGALLLETTQQMLAYTLGGSQFYLIAYALVFLLVMLLMPQGIVPSVQDLLRHRRRRAVVDAGGPDGTPSDTSPPAAPPVATGAAMTAVKGRA
jgi:branched-subunit amino acid ABC-type transport system permease component